MRAHVPLFVLLSACTGTIGGAVSDPPETSDPSRPPAPPPEVSTACASPDVGPTTITHLTRTEYGYAVEDLVGASRAMATSLSRDEWTDGQRDGVTNGFLVGAYVSPVLAEQYLELGRSIASERASAMTAECEAPGESCARQVLRRVAPRAFRSDLTTEREEELLTLYRMGAERSESRGIEMLLEGVLTAPEFLYHVESLGARDGERVTLGGYERASRLSFFLWRSIPDDALLEAARDESLASVEGMEREARRMLADPRAERGLRDFYEQWAGLRLLDGAVRDTTLYPELDDTLRSALRESFARFVVEVSKEGTFEDVFSSPFVFTSPALDEVVEGAPATHDGERRSSEVRRGVLGQPAFLAAHAHQNQTDPIRRGLFVRQRVLCQPLHPPAGLVLPPPPERVEGLTTRERFAEHRENEACAGCHALMDPIGFGLEAFDAVGRFRTHDEGQPIDSSGVLAGADVEERFDGLAELSERLSESEIARACFARQWLHFGLAREESEADECALARGYDALRGGSVADLLVAVVTSPSFLERRVPGI